MRCIACTLVKQSETPSNFRLELFSRPNMCLVTLIDTIDFDRLDILLVTPLLIYADPKLDAFP